MPISTRPLICALSLWLLYARHSIVAWIYSRSFVKSHRLGLRVSCRDSACMVSLSLLGMSNQRGDGGNIVRSWTLGTRLLSMHFRRNWTLPSDNFSILPPLSLIGWHVNIYCRGSQTARINGPRYKVGSIR